jgi:hypothetical protein
VCVFTRVKLLNHKASAQAARMEPCGPLQVFLFKFFLSLKLNREGLFALPPAKDLNHRLIDAQV